MEIKITCKGADLVPISDLQEFQGTLKTLSDTEFKKLKQSIVKHGFSFPVMVWKRGESRLIVDGHQRLFTLKKMLSDGYSIADNKIPVVWVEAENEKEAKEKILLAMSQFGKYTNESFYEFINLGDLNFQELKMEIDLPMIDLGKFEAGYVNTEQTEESEEYALILHFKKDDAAWMTEQLHQDRENHQENLDDKWRERCLLRLLRKTD
jgi:hypothetical protein